MNICGGSYFVYLTYIIAVWLIDIVFIFCSIVVCTVYKPQAYLIMPSPHFSVNHNFLHFFLNKQTRHGGNIVSFYFSLFISSRAECLSREQCVGCRM